MAQTKTGAVIGRPSTGLDKQIGVRLTPAMVERLNAAAAARGIDRSVLVREIVEDWAVREDRKGKAKK